jgi:hypothetical protein
MFAGELLQRAGEMDLYKVGPDPEERMGWIFRSMSNQQQSAALLLRYEGTIDRVHARALKQLEELQAKRRSRQKSIDRAQRNAPAITAQATAPDPANEPPPQPQPIQSLASPQLQQPNEPNPEPLSTRPPAHNNTLPLAQDQLAQAKQHGKRQQPGPQA